MGDNRGDDNDLNAGADGEDGAPGAANGEKAPESLKDAEILQNVLECLDNVDLEFDFKVLDVLEDEKATPAKIEMLKEQLGTLVATRLFSIANSVHYGKMRSGNITKFIDVVRHLGTDTARTTAIFVALLSLANTEELRIVFARNFATSRLTEVFAALLGFKGSDKSTAVLGGLFIEMGKVFMLLYADKESFQYKEGFIDKYHAHVGVKVIERFELPRSLIPIIDHPYFSFEKKDALTLPSVVHMAHAVVNDSFVRYGKFRIRSAMPDPQGLVYQSTAGSLLKEQFNIMGIGSYLDVIENEYTAQELRIIERGGQGGS